MSVNSNQPRSIMAERRLDAGLTQERLAQVAGCSIAYVRQVEGGYKPDPIRSPAYARLLLLLSAE